MPKDYRALLADNGVLLHEMIHQRLFENDEYASHDGAGWRREIMRLTKQITGVGIWAGRSVVRRIDGKPTRLNAPGIDGQPSLKQSEIACWPHSVSSIDAEQVLSRERSKPWP